MVNNLDAVIQSEMARQPVSATVSLHTYVEEDARIVGPVMYASFNYTTSDGTASNETVITTVTLLFQHPKYAVSPRVTSSSILFCIITECIIFCFSVIALSLVFIIAYYFLFFLFLLFIFSGCK